MIIDNHSQQPAKEAKMRLYQSILLGIVVGILAMFAVNYATGLEISAYIIALLIGIETGFWHFDKAKFYSFHADMFKFLFNSLPKSIISIRISNESWKIIGIALIFICSAIIYILNSIHGGYWIESKIFSDPDILTLGTRAAIRLSGNNTYKNFAIIEALGMVSYITCGIIYLLSSLENNIEMLFKNKTLLIISLIAVLAPIFNIILGICLVILCIVVFLYLVVALLAVISKFCAKAEGFTITTSIIIGITAGLAITGFTKLAFMPTLYSMTIGSISGLTFGFLMVQIGKLLTLFDSIESSTDFFDDSYHYLNL